MRALVHGWRHTEGRVCGVDIIGPVDLVAETSGRSPITTPEGPAQPGHRQRVGGLALRAPAAPARYKDPETAGRVTPASRVLHNQQVVVIVQDTCLLAGGHHSRRSSGAEGLRNQPNCPLKTGGGL